jgi:hypothetical protein
MIMASKKSKSGKSGKSGKSRASAKGKAGKVSAKAMAKVMEKLQPSPEPQFVAGQPDMQAKSAAFGDHMKRLMDQQG